MMQNDGKRRKPFDTRDRWSGSKFPITDTLQLARLARYPVVSLTRHALFAVVLDEYRTFRQNGRSARLPAAE